MITPPQLSRLVPVDVTSVWAREATSFTPWLLANADALGAALGFDLELDAAEHRVGGFSLDLIGRATDTGEIVIVENQFGTTDHRHLGQLLTYAGGTEPATIVWIAEGFRDEHRAAIDWLNQRTDEATRFFGVRLGAVTLQGAPTGLVAPLFEVVAKPNDWGKSVRTSAVETLSGKGSPYREFWARFLALPAAKGWTGKKPPARNWLTLPSGAARTAYVLSFRSDGLLSELSFRSQHRDVNQARWRLLADRRAEIEAAFGGPLVFDDLPHRKYCRIGAQRTADESIEDREAWPDYLAWFADTQRRLRAAIAAVGGIPQLAGDPVEDEPADEE